MIEHPVLPLDQIDLVDTPITGPKAATLGWLRKAGIPVPNGFVVSATVYDDFVERNDIVGAITRAEALSGEAPDAPELARALAEVDRGFAQGQLPEEVVRSLRASFRDVVDETGAVVARSSALGEDLPEASFAGQQLTVLNLRRFDDFLQALRRCWASLFSPPVLRYRARFTSPGHVPRIAVIVQAQITCQAAGTLFTVDPVSGKDHVVVEAVWGMGEALAQGEVSPDRYVVNRETLAEAARPRIGHKRCQRLPDPRAGTRLAPVPLWRRRRPVLSPTDLSGLTLLGLQIERLLGGSADVEWGLAGGRWFIFQARPITTRATSGLADSSDQAERIVWTSGFLDERLGDPVSPLGWSILREGLENVAFREPLRMIGVNPDDLEPITRLWNGRPYVNVAVFESLYKLFPDALLPEDARRFFPGGDVARRKRAAQPRSLFAPEVVAGVIRAFVRDPVVVSPFHNDRAWNAFEPNYVKAMAKLSTTTDEIQHEASPSLDRILTVVEAVERYNRRLLEIHRWSLTDAEVWYSLLRRIARLRFGDERGAVFSAHAVENLGDYSVELNRALAEIADLAQDPTSEAFHTALQRFLRDHGHRSFSLDLIRPNFAEDPSQVLALIRRDRGAGIEGQGRGDKSMATPSDGTQGSAPPDWFSRNSNFLPPTPWYLVPLVGITRRYVRLRENQRLTWQRGIALLRRLYLLAGKTLVQQSVLRQPEDVFFLTADEVRRFSEGASAAEVSAMAAHVDERRRRYADDCERNDYPHFLEGNQPLAEDDLAQPRAKPLRVAHLSGEPVSPGVGRGRARIVVHPDDLDAVEPGDVLVTRGADPGWTPVFDRIAALVMETGGQLSHASVVAREYRLPAVVGIPGATATIRPGEELVVDGSTGTVHRLGTSNLATFETEAVEG